MDMIAVGNRIKEAREQAHLTQEDLAEIVDSSFTHMSVIERGVKTLRLDTFVKILNVPKLSSNAFFLDVMTPLSLRSTKL